MPFQDPIQIQSSTWTMMGADAEDTASPLHAALAVSEARLRRVQRIGMVGGFEIELHSGINHRSGEYMALQGQHAAPVTERHQDWIARLHEPRGDIPYGLALAAGAMMAFPATPWFLALAR